MATMDDERAMLERRLWEDTPLYNLMCDVVNGERSDWPTGYGERSHVGHMTGNNIPSWERASERSGGDGA